jgi:hypothetical protein
MSAWKFIAKTKVAAYAGPTETDEKVINVQYRHRNRAAAR